MSNMDLSDEVTRALSDAIDFAFTHHNLQKSYGPSDRYGVTEWQASKRLPELGNALLAVSVAAWPKDDGVNIELADSIRTELWVVRSKILANYLSADQLKQPSFMLDQMLYDVQQAVKADFVSEVELHMHHSSKDDWPKGAREVVQTH